MGKPTGFLDYNRLDLEERRPEQRIADFNEFHIELTEEERKEQGGRCMDCGVPFCQSSTGCPVHNLIPEWNDLIYRGRYRDALEMLMLTNNFPEFTGSVCPAPCETACVLSLIEPAVTIKANESFMVEKGFEEGWIIPRPPSRRTGKRVAIVGSGPSGLAAAAQLNYAGHTVTVYERNDRFGGLLTYGIPNMKLGKARIERRINLMREEGIRFIGNAHVGVDTDALQLLDECDAMLLACGSTVPRDLPVEGRELAGIHFAVDYLASSTKQLLGIDCTALTAKNRRVIVIGGGDTGNDCVGTAIRQGCTAIFNFEIFPQPPEKRGEDNPWPAWPRVLRTDYGHREAITAFGRDPRIYSIATKVFSGNQEGKVNTVATIRVEWSQDRTGKFTMNEVPGTEEEYQADMVLLAMGFLGPENTLANKLGLELKEGGGIALGKEIFGTSNPKVFLAGDMRRGQSLVVWAIEEGRNAAEAIDRFLNSNT